jgi:hypothetical protein
MAPSSQNKESRKLTIEDGGVKRAGDQEDNTDIVAAVPLMRDRFRVARKQVKECRHG